MIDEQTKKKAKKISIYESSPFKSAKQFGPEFYTLIDLLVRKQLPRV